MRAVVLVTAVPGGGQAVVDAVRDDPRFRRAFATFGPFGAVCELLVDDHDDLLDAIAVVNDVEQQVASETLLDMEVAEQASAPAAVYGEGGVQAVSLVMESKHLGCHFAHTMFAHVRKASDAIEDVYPLLGRYDDAVWMRGQGLGDLSQAVRSFSGVDGVRDVLTLVEASARD